jgi:hypothetical protein
MENKVKKVISRTCLGLLLIGLLNIVEMLSGNAVDLTGLRDVLQIFS